MAYIYNPSPPASGGATEGTLQDAVDVLNFINTYAQSIDENTDTLEAKVTDTISAINNNGSVNHTDILSVISELQGLDSNTDGIEASLTSIISNTTGLSTAANQSTEIAKLTSIDGKDFATQTTLALIKAKTDNLDIAISTLRDSLRGAGTKDFTTIQTTIDAAKVDLDNIYLRLDVALSTRNAEVTQLLIKAKTDNLDIATSALRDAIRGGGTKDLTTLQTALDAVKVDLDNIYARLDVALSTRNAEATQLLIKAKTDNLDIALSAFRDALRGSGTKDFTTLQAELALKTNEATFTARLNTLGQKTMALSAPVSIASDQSAIPISASALPLPTGAATEATSATRLSEADFDTKTGAINETAPATDTASSGLNGRMQRIAQRITSLIALIPASLGQKASASSLAVTISSEQETILSARLSESDFDTKTGSLTESAPASDTASSGLNGRMQRIAQRLTSLIALIPTSLGQKTSAGSLAVTLSSEQEALLGGLTETAPATDTASAGHNGRLQRIAQRLTSLIALLPAALVGGRLDTNIGSWLGSTAPTIGQKSKSQSIPVVHAVEGTFVVYAQDIAIGNGKSMVSIQNTTGSTVVVKIRDLKIKNVQSTTVAGVLAEFRLYRATSHAAGTAITPLSFDSTDSLNASVTARTGATITGEAANFMRRWIWSSDEWGTNDTGAELIDHISQELISAISFIHGAKHITLNANETVHIKQQTNSTVGTFDLEVIFTQE